MASFKPIPRDKWAEALSDWLATIPRSGGAMSLNLDQYRPVDKPQSSDEWALQRAIVDAPYDVAPRLVYADWLDELYPNGEPSPRTHDLRTWTNQKGGYASLTRCHFLHAWPEPLIEWLLHDGYHIISDSGEGNTLLSRHSHFFQAVRSGAFLHNPIQRVLIVDRWPTTYQRSGAVFTAWFTDLNLARLRSESATVAIQGTVSTEFGTLITEWREGKIYRQAERELGLIMDSLIYEDKQCLCLMALSQAAVRLGRMASGLSAIDIPLEDYPLDLYKTWKTLFQRGNFSG